MRTTLPQRRPTRPISRSTCSRSLTRLSDSALTRANSSDDSPASKREEDFCLSISATTTRRAMTVKYGRQTAFAAEVAQHGQIFLDDGQKHVGDQIFAVLARKS